jgi:hypothetical protein
MFLEGLAQRSSELRDEAPGGFIAEPLENAGASDDIRKDNGSHDASLFLVNEACPGNSMRGTCTAGIGVSIKGKHGAVRGCVENNLETLNDPPP